MTSTLITPTAVDELTTKRDAKRADAQAIAQKAIDEGRDFTPAEKTQLVDLRKEYQAVQKDLAKATDDADLLAWVQKADEGIAINTPGPVSKSKGSVGDRFMKDGGIVDYLKSIAPNGGQVSDMTSVKSPAVHFHGLKDILSAGDHDGSVGPLVGPDFRGLLDAIGTTQRPLTIRDLVSSGSTTSDAVSYARILDTTNNAATVAEATGTSAGDASGDVTGAKPESSIEYEPVTEAVRTIAHWIPMTKRALSDAAQIRTAVDNFLRYGLEEELEDQIIDGDGSGENFEGILHVSGTQTQAFSTDALISLRKAKTKAIVNGRGRNISIAINPVDDESIDLIRDSTGQYIGGGPFRPNDNTIWGMRRAVSEAVPAGHAIVGDWNYATLWDREQAAVMLSDSHADFFTRNLVAALAELRAAFGVIRPAAFVITDVAA